MADSSGFGKEKKLAEWNLIVQKRWTLVGSGKNDKMKDADDNLDRLKRFEIPDQLTVTEGNGDLPKLEIGSEFI